MYDSIDPSLSFPSLAILDVTASVVAIGWIVGSLACLLVLRASAARAGRYSKSVCLLRCTPLGTRGYRVPALTFSSSSNRARWR